MSNIKKKDWAELYDKRTGSLIRIVYAPFTRDNKQLIKDWILPEFYNDVRVIRTY